jgi:hypothetical protein
MGGLPRQPDGGSSLASVSCVRVCDVCVFVLCVCPRPAVGSADSAAARARVRPDRGQPRHCGSAGVLLSSATNAGATCTPSHTHTHTHAHAHIHTQMHTHTHARARQCRCVTVRPRGRNRRRTHSDAALLFVTASVDVADGDLCHTPPWSTLLALARPFLTCSSRLSPVAATHHPLPFPFSVPVTRCCCCVCCVLLLLLPLLLPLRAFAFCVLLPTPVLHRRAAGRHPVRGRARSYSQGARPSLRTG